MLFKGASLFFGLFFVSMQFTDVEQKHHHHLKMAEASDSDQRSSVGLPWSGKGFYVVEESPPLLPLHHDFVFVFASVFCICFFVFEHLFRHRVLCSWGIIFLSLVAWGKKRRRKNLLWVGGCPLKTHFSFFTFHNASWVNMWKKKPLPQHLQRIWVCSKIMCNVLSSVLSGFTL